MNFSSYKNKNTSEVLIGISSGGVVIFVSSLFILGQFVIKKLIRVTLARGVRYLMRLETFGGILVSRSQTFFSAGRYRLQYKRPH